MPAALGHLRICDFTGQLAGAGATKYLAAMGAQVIRIEDPVRQGRWDILRGMPPYVDERRGVNLSGAFNNHNTDKLGVTINLRTEAGRDLVRRLIAISDVVTENFAAGVLARLGFSYEEMTRIRPDVIYVSNSGFGATGPYRSFKTWGPIVQAMSSLTFSSGIANHGPAGWGYSYMDHQGANVMAVAILAALLHRRRTGEGQWVDMGCTEAGAWLNGLALLDVSANGRVYRDGVAPDSNHSRSPAMAPHGIYPARGDDRWVAIACRHDQDWAQMVAVVGEAWTRASELVALAGRVAAEPDLDRRLAEWTATHDAADVAARLQAAGVPAATVATPEERIERDPGTSQWGLWPEVEHTEIGRVRVDGIPIHLSVTDWNITRGAPCLGEHNDYVFGEVLGLAADEIAALREQGAI
jgi:crotonobetainyl-CoA:carnitine CoA-transferase CaiB-like acyl-CoA transferase